MPLYTALPFGLFVAIALLFVAGVLIPRRLHTETNIQASPEMVWGHLTNGQDLGWNPFMTALSGDLRPGEVIDVELKIDGMAPMQISPRLLVANPARELRWKGKMGLPGLFDGEHIFKLEQQPDGSTRLIHGEKFTGILVPLLFPWLKQPTRNGFLAMNAALKTRAERG
jgi:hypothetical protein